MNLKILIACITILTLLGIGTSLAQWSIYDCSLLPVDADTAWHEQGDDTDDVTGILSVIDDPDIPGNKLIMVDENQGPVKEMWRMNWNADPDFGATLVFRCIALDPTVYSRDFDLYIYNGLVRERLVSNRGSEIKLNKAGVAAEVNTAEWHIYRMIIIGDLIEVYVDEDPLASLSAIGEPLDEPENNLFRFGDLGSATIGTLYDWFIWDVSGAYPPGDGTPIPEDLLETGSTYVDENNISNQDYSFQLSQNYPNPFNPMTEIPFQITTQNHVQLKIYNINGKLIHSLVNETKLPGTYRVFWDGRDMYQNTSPSGTYFYSLETDSHKLLRKMTLLK